METRRLNGSKLRTATYDAREQRLSITFSDGSVRVFKAVPRPVFERLAAAPNAQAYYEDRIVEEYPTERAATVTSDKARNALDDLFKG
jgi:YD repeat-containing protein